MDQFTFNPTHLFSHMQQKFSETTILEFGIGKLSGVGLIDECWRYEIIGGGGGGGAAGEEWRGEEHIVRKNEMENCPLILSHLRNERMQKWKWCAFLFKFISIVDNANEWRTIGIAFFLFKCFNQPY